VTKGSVQQTLPVTQEIGLMIQHLPPNSPKDLPIVAILSGRTQPIRWVSSQFQRLKKLAGVRPELRIHDLRRAAAETAWTVTKDLRAVQALLGHRKLSTTDHYLHNRVSLQHITPTVQAMRAHRAEHRTHVSKPFFRTCAYCNSTHATPLPTLDLDGRLIPFCSEQCQGLYLQMPRPPDYRRMQ
jgi:hypothetical protein